MHDLFVPAADSITAMFLRTIRAGAPARTVSGVSPGSVFNSLTKWCALAFSSDAQTDEKDLEKDDEDCEDFDDDDDDEDLDDEDFLDDEDDDDLDDEDDDDLSDEDELDIDDDPIQ